MIKGERVNSPSQKGRGEMEGAEVQQGCRRGCGFEHVSSAENCRNLLAFSPSREHAIKKFHEEKHFEEICRSRALHERAGWCLKDTQIQRRGQLHIGPG